MAKRRRRRRNRLRHKKVRPPYEVVVALREIVLKYLLKHPCKDCNEDDIVVLQFDHVKGRKIDNISVMIREGVPKEMLLAEMAKCEVRCANCHARKTAREQNWTKARYYST